MNWPVKDPPGSTEDYIRIREETFINGFGLFPVVNPAETGRLNAILVLR